MVGMTHGREEEPQKKSRGSAAQSSSQEAAAKNWPDELDVVDRSGMAVMKKEIDALQIALAEPSRPWWKQASSWIAIFALLVTIVTAIQQGRQTEQEREQGNIAAEAELSTVLTQIASVQRERIDAKSLPTDARDPVTEILNAQSLVWSYKGADLVDRREGSTNAAEYFAVAQIFKTQIGPTDRVLKYLGEAVNRAQDVRTYVLAGSELAIALIRRGQPVEADAAFARAVSPEKRLMEGTSEDQVLNELSFAQISWAYQLRLRNDCQGWKHHLDQAEQMTKRMAELGYPSEAKARLDAERDTSCPASEPGAPTSSLPR
jgi:hypothetical protein